MKKKGLRRILIVFLILTASVLILLSPLFRIKHIEVSGADTDDEIKKEISEALSASLNQNGFMYVMKNIKGMKNIDYFFMLRAKSAEEKLAFELPYLKNIKIRYNFPSGLEVTYMKRNPSFLVNTAGVYICSDSEGVIINTYSDNDKIQLPILKGLSIVEYKIGSTIITEEKEKLENVKNFFQILEQCDKEFKGYKISKIIDIVDFSEYNNIWLFIGENLKVKLGDSEDLITKFAQLKGICDKEKDKLENGTLTGVIDFTLGMNPVLRS